MGGVVVWGGVGWGVGWGGGGGGVGVGVKGWLREGLRKFSEYGRKISD